MHIDDGKPIGGWAKFLSREDALVAWGAAKYEDVAMNELATAYEEAKR